MCVSVCVYACICNRYFQGRYVPSVIPFVRAEWSFMDFQTFMYFSFCSVCDGSYCSFVLEVIVYPVSALCCYRAEVLLLFFTDQLCLFLHVLCVAHIRSFEVGTEYFIYFKVLNLVLMLCFFCN